MKDARGDLELVEPLDLHDLHELVRDKLARQIECVCEHVHMVAERSDHHIVDD